MTEDPKVLLAAERAALARMQLTDGLAEIRNRLSPGTLASSVASGLKTKGIEAVETGVDTVRENRWAVAGIATIGALFLARRPITALFDGDHETGERSGRSENKTTLPKDRS